MTTETQQVEAVKITQWAKEPSLEDLKHDFIQAQNSHATHIADVKRWNDNFNVKNTATGKEGDKKQKSTIAPKLIRKQAEWRSSALSEPFLTTPELFKVDPVTHEDKLRAVQNELLLNNQFSTQIPKVFLIDSIIRTAVKEGSVILRVGWEYQEEKIKKEVPVYDYNFEPAFEEQLQQLMQLKQSEPDTYEATVPEEIKESVNASIENGQAVIATQTGVEEEETTKVIVNKPTIEVCNIHNVYIDPTCEGNFDKAQFVIHSFESSLSALSKDSKYINLDKLRMNTNDGHNSEYHSYSEASVSFNFKDAARKKLTVHEYWGFWDIDGKGTVKPIVAAWVGNVLIRMEENPFPDKGLPFIVIPYIPKEGSVYGIPDGELLEDNQKILGAVTRGTIDLLGKSANSQTGTAKGMLDATNRIRFRNGDDYEYNPNSNPAAQVFMHKYPEIPQSAMWVINWMNTDAEAMSGTKAFSSQGISGAGLGDTAAGVRSAMDAASKREMSILRRISEGIIKVGRKMLAMNAEWLSEEEVVRVTNSQFVTIRRDDLPGNYDLRLSISTAESDEAKAKELAFMLQTMGNNMDKGMSRMILSEIARLRRMPDLAQRISTYEEEPDPMQQQMQQLQMQLLQAQIMLAQAQAQEASAKSEVQGAKVGVEHARAESMQGDADNKALNFVEARTGLKHQREMDKLTINADTSLESQRLKNLGSIEQQLAQFGVKQRSDVFKHNSDLLKIKAQQEVAPRQGQSF